jgi:lipid-A-disaccharide synthase
MHVLLVTNGPGELYTWVTPVLKELRKQAPDWRIAIGVIPCQFASGREVDIAQTLVGDVFSPTDTMRTITLGQPLTGFSEDAKRGLVLSLGGSIDLAVRLAAKLGWDVMRYHFEPAWHKGLHTLFVTDEKNAQKVQQEAGARAVPIGNLVADALAELADTNIDANIDTNSDKLGSPHVLVMAGSRDGFARYVLPLMLAVIDRIRAHYPQARFVYPRSRLLTEQGFRAALQGDDLQGKNALGGTSGRFDEQKNCIVTEAGTVLELIAESARYAHMKSADIALTIPGTNTLELGMAHLPSVVAFPLNKPEAIPLEGLAHWLTSIPLLGTPLKRRAVRLAAPHLPASLPNHFAGETLMVELKGVLHADDVSKVALELLADEPKRQHIRTRLRETMPQPGAAAALVRHLIDTYPDTKQTHTEPVTSHA